MYNYQHMEKPWYCQLHYQAICVFTLVYPFLFKFGARPLLVAGLAFVAMLMQLDRRRSIARLNKPIELKFYTAWGVWCVLTGMFVAEDNFVFTYALMTLGRTILLIWVAFAIFSRQKLHNYMFILLILVGIIQVAATHLGYHVDNLSVARDVFDAQSKRAEGLTGNANAMGFVMLAGIWGAVMFWRSSVSRRHFSVKILLVFVIALFSFMLVQTASRKSLLGIAGVLAGWLLWMIPGKISAKSVVVAFFMLLVVSVGGMYAIQNLLPDTMMGRRFTELSDRGRGSSVEGFKADIRYVMIMDGLAMFCNHPITGVGLNQFQVHHFTGTYSHSDYIESLACTGLVGFILYQGFAVAILLRLLRLLKRQLPDDIDYLIKGMVLYMLFGHFAIGFGAPLWYSIDHIMVLMFIGTFAWKIEQIFVKNRYIYLT